MTMYLSEGFREPLSNVRMKSQIWSTVKSEEEEDVGFLRLKADSLHTHHDQASNRLSLS